MNDAFGTAHREHASTFGAAQALAGKPRVIGSLIQKELKFLGDAISNPKRVVFPEGEEPKIIRAAYICVEDGIAMPILLGGFSLR